MHRLAGLFLALTLAVAVVAAVHTASGQAPAAPSRPPDQNGWQLPPGAADEKAPMEATADVLAKGKALFKENCQRCHGVEGKGNGPDADPDEKPDDLSDGSRAARNPDGVMFYKVWNGRKKPRMPAFKEKMTREEAWTVVLYAKTLRKQVAGH